MTDRRRLLDVHLAAASFYRHALAEARRPRDYLTERGIDRLDEMADEHWVIGYAPPGWTTLLTHLEASGFTDTDIHAAGLAVATRRGTLIDRFRDRIMFGVHDPGGELIGFVGRSAPGAADVPKYLNSPATDLYTKGRHLFGLTEQHDLLAHRATPVLVEGPFDVIAVDTLAHRSHAMMSAVSTCGTTLRPEQADLLRQHSSGEVIVAFDGDDAGRRAAQTAYKQLIGRFDHIWAAPLPQGEDPASLARSNAVGLLNALRARKPLADQLVDDALGRYRLDNPDNAEARVAALRDSTRLVAQFAPADVSRQVPRIAERLDFDPDLVTQELTSAFRQTPRASRGAASVERRGRTRAACPGWPGSPDRKESRKEGGEELTWTCRSPRPRRTTPCTDS